MNKRVVEESSSSTRLKIWCSGSWNADPVSSFLFAVKNPRLSEPQGGGSQQSENGFISSLTGCTKSSATEEALDFSATTLQSLVPTNQVSETSEAVGAVQDQPLSFDQTRLAVAAASFRGTPVQPASSQTQSLARILQGGLPNLNNSLSRKIFSQQSRDREKNNGTSETFGGQKSALQENISDCEAAGRKSSNSRTVEETTAHVLGLDCYSSSDEDCDTWCFLILYILQYKEWFIETSVVSFVPSAHLS